MLERPLLGFRAQAVFGFQIRDGAADRLQGVLRADRAELEDRRAREDGIVDIEIRVLRRGGNQGDLPVFDILQQRLLLLFVEILDLVEVQQHAVRREERVELGVDLPDVRRRGRRRVEPEQLPPRLRGDQVGHRGLSGAGRAVENQVRDFLRFDDPAQKAVRAQDVLLPADVLQTFRAELVRQGLIHGPRLLFSERAPIIQNAA